MEKQLAQGHPRSCTSLGLTPHLIVLSTRLSVFPAYLFPAVSFSGAFLLFAQCTANSTLHIELLVLKFII